MIGRLSPRRRRAAAAAAGAEPTAHAPDAAPPADAAAVPLEQPTVVQAAVPPLTAPGPGTEVALPPPDPSVPAGLELQPPAEAPAPVPSWRHRGRLRRRLRYLRRVRELGFRDLGGLAFDLHRFGRDGRELVRVKLDALTAVDTELRALERALDDRREYVELREPGIAACPRCAALHASDARFCPGCGLHLDGPMALAEVGDAPGTSGAPAGDGERAGAPAAPVGVGGTPGAKAAPAGLGGVTAAPVGAADAAPGATAPAGDGLRAADTGSSPVSSGAGPLPPDRVEQPTTAQGTAPPPPAEPAPGP